MKNRSMYHQKCSFSHLLLLLAFTLAAHVQGNGPATMRDDFDDLIALVDSQEITNLITSSSVSSSTTRKPNKEFIVNILNDLEVIPLLQEDFFLRTNNIVSRSLLDYPEFLPWRHDKDKRAVYVILFLNQTTRMHFTKGSSNICTYLGVTQASFLQKLENIIRSVQGLFPELTIDGDKITRLLQLFQTFTVQERRFGFMIGGKATFNRWHFNIMAPWYYIERNHFVNQNVQDDIEALVEDILEETLGVTQLTPEEIDLATSRRNAFIDQHLISDKFGIGDTRIYLDHPVIKNKYLSTRLGLLATIPTAFAMKKGLKGTHLHRVINRPILDLINLVEKAMPGSTTQVTQQAFDFALDALDNLGAMILNPPMGNGGHFGLGVLAKNRSPLSGLIKQDWARRFIMRSFISLEYLFPATEWRSFRVPANEALFNARDFTQTTDQLIINSNFYFLLQQLTDRLFPIAIHARVSPGVVFRWSSQMCYEGDENGFTLGTDTYVRNRENLSHLDATPATKSIIDAFNARAPLAYQSKLVGSIFFKIEKPDRLHTISLLADYTMMNKGIGADFMLALNIDTTF